MKFILIFSLLFSQLLIADEHALTTLTGTQINLQAYDHAIAGSVKNFLIFGSKDESTGKSELIIKKDGIVTKANFGINNGQFSGNILYMKKIETDGNVSYEMKSKTFTLSSINRDDQIITLEVS